MYKKFSALSVISLAAMLFATPARPAAADCSLDAVDEASLEAAISCFNSLGAGDHAITLHHNIKLTHPGTQITNPLAASLTVEGNGHTLNAGKRGRGLTIFQVAAVTVRNLTIKNGFAPENEGGRAGALFAGCGEDSPVFCAIRLENLTLRNNSAADGGALWLGGWDNTIISSTIRGNSATRGGGVFLTGAYINKTRILNSTIQGNSASQSGGGIGVGPNSETLGLTLVNSTISKNEALLGGGGISVEEADGDSDVDLRLVNSTIAYNKAAQGAGLLLSDGDQQFDALARIARPVNTIISNNSGINGMAGVTNCQAAGAFAGSLFESGGHNLDGDGSCLTPAVAAVGDLPAAAARLRGLSRNNGPTKSHGLKSGSAALDAGDAAVCAAAPVDAHDQRGVSRPQGAGCDIGAYERVVNPTQAFDTAADDAPEPDDASEAGE